MTMNENRTGSARRITLSAGAPAGAGAIAGKGEGIRALMRLEPYSGRRPIFVGDDKTDESGFEAVNALNGMSVKIGPGDTLARYRLASPAAFRTIMGDWLARGLDGISLPRA